MSDTIKSSNQIVSFIEKRIGNIYLRPLMYGKTPCGVDTVLHYYHELWAEIHDKVELYHTIQHEMFEGPILFATKLKSEIPEASDKDILSFSLGQWMKLSKELGLRLPK